MEGPVLEDTVRFSLTLALPLLLLPAACAKKGAAPNPPPGNPAPAEAKAGAADPVRLDPAALSPKRIDLAVDGAGDLSVLGEADYGKDSSEGRPPARKPVLWGALPALLSAACEAAPRDYSDVRVSKEWHPESGAPERARVLLRWNPAIKKCKFYVGQVLCNYNDDGLARARARIQTIRQARPAEREVRLDIADEVPMQWALEAVRMLLAEGAEPDFAGSAEPHFEGAPAPVSKPYTGTDAKGYHFPDVTVLVRVDPETPYGHFAVVLEQCACRGIHKVFLRGKPGEMLSAFLPRDASAETEPRGK